MKQQITSCLSTVEINQGWLTNYLWFARQTSSKRRNCWWSRVEAEDSAKMKLWRTQNVKLSIPVHFSVKKHTHGGEIVDQLLCFFVQGRAKTNMVAGKFNSSGSIVWFEKENSRKITITCFLPMWPIFTIKKKKQRKNFCDSIHSVQLYVKRNQYFYTRLGNKMTKQWLLNWQNDYKIHR